MTAVKKWPRGGNRVATAPGIAVIKVYQEAWRRTNELQAVELAHRGGAAVARVLWSNPRPLPHTCFSFVAGPTLIGASPHQSIIAATTYLDRIHAVTGSQFGRLKGPHFVTWQEFLHDRLDHYLDALGTQGQVGACHVASALRGTCAPSALSPRLIHNDPNPANFIDGPGGLTAIDWELAAFGDPALDIARAAWEWGLSPGELCAIRPSQEYDTDTLRYYQTLHVLGRLMSASTSTRPNLLLQQRCIAWLDRSPWDA